MKPGPRPAAANPRTRNGAHSARADHGRARSCAAASQAVRLPKEFRFSGDEVFIKRVGSAVVLLPKARSWETLIGSLSKFSADFMSERTQPPHQSRETLD